MRGGSCGGFSLIEAMVAMMIFGVTVLAVYGGVSLGLTTIRHTREQQKAMQIMVDALEMIRLYSWEELSTPGFVPKQFTVKDNGSVAKSTTLGAGAPSTGGTGVNYHGKISISDPSFLTNYDSRLKEVEVELVWQSGGMERKRQLKTLITFGGLYAYLF